MARGKKTGGRNIQKGQVLNPRGGLAHDPVLKAIRRLSRSEIAEIGTLLLEKNYQALKAIIDDPTTSVLRLMVASVANRVIAKGDHAAFATLLEQIAGKPKERIEHSGELTMNHFTPQQVRRAAQLVLERKIEDE
jgi:hypothetical protein